jgi:hypothetical protein
LDYLGTVYGTTAHMTTLLVDHIGEHTGAHKIVFDTVPQITGLTASVPVVTDASKNLASVSYATFKSSLAIAQADVSGLTTGDSPTFVQGNFTTLHTTTILADHIGEHTGAHQVIFDNMIRADSGIGINVSANATVLLNINAGFTADTDNYGISSSVFQNTARSTRMVVGGALAATASFTSGTQGYCTGARGVANSTGSGGTTTAARAGDFIITITTGHTITYAQTIIAENPYKPAGTITYAYGLYLDDITSGSTNYGIYTSGSAQAYFGGNVSALSFTDRTVYPKDKQEAYNIIKSMVKKNDIDEIDHTKLHPKIKQTFKTVDFVYSADWNPITLEGTKTPVHRETVGRDLSMVVSSLVEIIKDLSDRIDQLEKM